MAKIILSGLLTSLTGKLGGSVFQVSTGSLQMRTRVSPRNPATSYQQRSRGTYAFLSGNYNNLSVANRQTWIDNFPAGSSGPAFYIAVNQVISAAGQSLITAFTPGTALASATPVIVQLSAALFTFQFNPTFGITPANRYVNVYATSPKSAGTLFLSPSSFVFLTALAPGINSADLFDIFTIYTNRFGAIATGKVVGLRTCQVDVVKGLVGPSGQDQANAT